MYKTFVKNLSILVTGTGLMIGSAVQVWADLSEDELRLRALEEKVEALQPKKRPSPSYNTHGVKKQATKPVTFYKKGMHFESADGLFSTNLQWRAQMRFANPDDGDPDTPSDYTGDDANNFGLRRVRMKIGGHGYKPWLKYYFEADLQPSRTVSKDTARASSRIIDWRIDVQPWREFGLRFGQWKINYNRERVDSSGRQQFVERSIVNKVFTIDRQVGVLAKGRLNKGTVADIRYYAGVFNGEGRSVDNENTNMMYMGRLQWNFLGRDLAWRQSDVKRHKDATGSLAFGYATNEGSCTRWSSSGCDSLSGFSVGDSDQFETDQWVQEFAFKYQGLSIQEEYHEKDVKDNDTGLEYDLDGGYAQAGYFFNEIMPSVPEQLELAFRYAFVNEPDHGDTTVEQKRKEYTVAVNYFIAGHNNKVTLDYSYLTLDDGNDGRDYNDSRIRLQWDISF